MAQTSAGNQGFGGLPVAAGATWANPGRTTGQFTGTSVRFNTASVADINFGNTNVGGFDDDPQGVGNIGQTWYVLFKFQGSDAYADNSGWRSCDAPHHQPTRNPPATGLPNR